MPARQPAGGDGVDSLEEDGVFLPGAGGRLETQPGVKDLAGAPRDGIMGESQEEIVSAVVAGAADPLVSHPVGQVLQGWRREDATEDGERPEGADHA